MKQQYRINAKLRRRGEAALEDNRIEFKSEEFNDDEEYCAAIANELYELIKADREYLDSMEGENEPTYKDVREA